MEKGSFRTQVGRNGASMDWTTFQLIAASFKDKGLDGAEVMSYRDYPFPEYGFTYTIDGDGYSASFIQLQPSWSEAAVVCLQTIVQHLEHLERIGQGRWRSRLRLAS